MEKVNKHEGRDFRAGDPVPTESTCVCIGTTRHVARPWLENAPDSFLRRMVHFLQRADSDLGFAERHGITCSSARENTEEQTDQHHRSPGRQQLARTPLFRPLQSLERASFSPGEPIPTVLQAACPTKAILSFDSSAFSTSEEDYRLRAFSLHLYSCTWLDNGDTIGAKLSLY